MDNLDLVEKKINELFGVIDQLASEKRKLEIEAAAFDAEMSKLKDRIKMLGDVVNEYDGKIKSLEEEKSAAIQHQEGINEERYLLKRKNLELQKVTEMARLKAEDVLNNIERLEMERRS